VAEEPYGRLARTFDTAAELYERARPRYPDQLFADLAATTGLGGRPARVAEIGPGTGQATRGLLASGWRVVALEPGRELATVARRVLAGQGDLVIEPKPFENWRPATPASFDLVFAATSWHWVDPRVGYPHAAEVLRPGGSLAIVATVHVLPEQDGDLFFREVEAVYDAVGLGDGLGGPRPPAAIEAPDLAPMRASGLFADPVVHRYVWSQVYSAAQYLDVLSTYSGHIAATPDQRAELFAGIRALIAARPTRTVRKHYLNLLQVARRLP
jgi:SAM-dependent methyltransferase